MTGAFAAATRPPVRPGASAGVIEVRDPSDGSLIDTVAVVSREDVGHAVESAGRAAPGWAATHPEERSEIVRRLAAELRARIDDLTSVQVRECGRPRRLARGGAEAGLATMEQYAHLGPLHRGRSLQGAWGATDLMVPVPRGVAAVLTPWNDPVAISLGLVAANLVVGNAVLLKPSERSPLHARILAEAARGVVPPGVLTVLHGDGQVGAALVEHAGVDVVAHVGSVSTGRWIAQRCAARLAKAVLELGGNDPLVVDAGVDPAWAAEQAATGAFLNTGQICTSVERIYVDRRVAEPFVAELVDRAERLVVGPPGDGGTDMGPLIDDAQLQVVDRHVRQAVEAGATIRTGGHRLDLPGSFYAPTVLTDVREDMAVMAEETFGPVAPVRVVDSFDEALTLADGGPYGLAATVLTPSQAHAQEAWRRLRVGTVKVNAVFGGAPGGAATPHGHSGTGFGYGPELLDELTHTRVLHIEGLPA